MPISNEKIRSFSIVVHASENIATDCINKFHAGQKKSCFFLFEYVFKQSYMPDQKSGIEVTNLMRDATFITFVVPKDRKRSSIKLLRITVLHLDCLPKRLLNIIRTLMNNTVPIFSFVLFLPREH
jgi:hypothetical protein